MSALINLIRDYYSLPIRSMEAVWPRKRVSCPETPSSNSMRWICANFATKTPWGPSPMPATLSSWPWLGKILWWILAFSLQPASTRFNSLQLASTRSYPPSHPPCHPPPRFNPLQPALTRFNPLQPGLTRHVTHPVTHPVTHHPRHPKTRRANLLPSCPWKSQSCYERRVNM